MLSFSVSRYPSSTVAECIRKARLEKGLRLVDAALAIKVDEMTVADWERYKSMPGRAQSKIEPLYAFGNWT